MRTRNFFATACFALTLLIGTAASAQKEKTVTVGGAPMYPSKNIIENAVNSKDHTTLVAAVKAAGLVETLQEKGPFTVFAPTNEAFAKLPKGTVETLLKPENLKTLQTILTYHVVAGKMSTADIAAAIKKGGGKATLKTVSGGTLEFTAFSTMFFEGYIGAPPTVTVFSFCAKMVVVAKMVKAKKAVDNKFLVFIIICFLKVI